MTIRNKLLISLGVLMVLGSFMTAGTLATFSAQTSNPSNVFGNGSMTMTNVAGTAVSGINCTTATTNGTCATLFSSSTTGFQPGGADSSNTVTITYTGSITTASFGLHAANYTSESGGSAASCTAADPASKLNLQIKQGSTIVYPTSGSGYGSLSSFATTFSSNAALLHLDGGSNGAGTLDQWATSDSSVFTININLDTSADNTYQGCQSQTDFVWYAAQ